MNLHFNGVWKAEKIEVIERLNVTKNAPIDYRSIYL